MLKNTRNTHGYLSRHLGALFAASGIALLALSFLSLPHREAALAQAPPAITTPSTALINDVPPVTSAPTPVFAPTPALGTQIVAEPKVEFYPVPTEAERRIDEALETRTSVDFNETPLKTVAAFMRETLNGKVEIQLDRRALEDAGVSEDTPVTRTIGDLPVRSVLQLILDDFDLTFLVQNDILMITTEDEAETELFTRTYPVADLLVAAPTQPGNTVQKDFDTLINAITKTVKPPAWDEVGGPGSITDVQVSACIVVSQTQPVHDEVLKLLRALRAAKREATIVSH